MTFEEDYKVCDKALADIDAELKKTSKKRKAILNKLIPVSKKSLLLTNENLLKVTFGLLSVSKQVLGILEQLGMEEEADETDNGMYE